MHEEFDDNDDDGPGTQRRKVAIGKAQWLDVIALDKELPPAAKVVALTVAQHINRKSGAAWPGSERIAELTGYSPQYVRAQLDLLEVCGYLDVERTKNRGLGFRRSKFWLITPASR